jgi:hypothetical protein
MVERYLADQGLPYTVFQPLYIYGPHTAKDCEQWFIDRVIRSVHMEGGGKGSGAGQESAGGLSCVCRDLMGRPGDGKAKKIQGNGRSEGSFC